jgi:hypothetical protein
MPESLDSKGINEIVNTTPLSQGGEGVKCASAEVTEQIGKAIANVDYEPAVQVTPSTPAKVGAKHKEFKKGDRVVIQSLLDTKIAQSLTKSALYGISPNC